MIDSIFEGNTGVGYYVSGGAQINIEGNVIEGNGESPAVLKSFADDDLSRAGCVLRAGGPGVVVMGASGVTLTSNVSATNPAHDTCTTKVL